MLKKKGTYVPKRRYRKKVNVTKILIVTMPVVIAVVVLTGVLFAIKDYNKVIDVGVIKLDGILNTDSEQVNLSEEESKKVLTIVSNDYKLPDDYKVNLVKVKGVSCDSLIVSSLKTLISDAKKDGINLVLTKGYVSPEEQDKLYNDKVKELFDAGGITIVRSEFEAKKITPPAGYSEYQTGLSVEFNTTDNVEKSQFSSTDAYTWLVNNSVNYGFILRYPESKETATKMKFDPTYFRFVGVDNAKKIRAMDMCFDEYYKYVNSR